MSGRNPLWFYNPLFVFVVVTLLLIGSVWLHNQLGY